MTSFSVTLKLIRKTNWHTQSKTPLDWSLCFSHLCEAVWTDFGQTGAQVEACFDSFFPLASVAEPNSDHFLFQMETFGDSGYLLGGWLTFLNKAALQGLFCAKTAVWKESDVKAKFYKTLYSEQCSLAPQDTHLIVVLLFLFRSFIPILSLYKAEEKQTKKYIWIPACLFFLTVKYMYK